MAERNNGDPMESLTVRDYFAGQALISLTKESLAPVVKFRGKEMTDREEINEAISLAAYRIADAMLKQREE